MKLAFVTPSVPDLANLRQTIKLLILILSVSSQLPVPTQMGGFRLRSLTSVDLFIYLFMVIIM